MLGSSGAQLTARVPRYTAFIIISPSPISSGQEGSIVG